jgi:hypothetical protein
MNTKIILQRRELDELLRLIDKFDCDYAVLEQSESNGIGSVLTAKLPLTLKDETGEFVVEISGVEDW